MRWFRDQVDGAFAWPYTPDSRDRVVPLADVPQSDVGAPLPVVLATDHRLTLLYLLDDTPAEWDGTWTRIVSPRSENVPIAVVRFDRAWAHIFGPPNDEAIAGHPLAVRGLHPYGAFIVEESSWIRSLERMNSVHEHHRPERFGRLNHYAFVFHDSTFECAADGLSVTVHRGSLRAILTEAASDL